MGAHVLEDQLYDGVRFKIDDPSWTAHLATQGGQSVADGSALHTELSDDGVWIVYAPAIPRSLRDLEQRVVSGCVVLMQLALDIRLKARETEVRIGAGPWLPVHGSGFRATVAEPDVPLLEPTELTIGRFAHWISLNATLDGLAWGVVEPVKAPIQVQALAATSLVEGIHRRLPFEQSQFPGLTGKAKGRIRRAARSAAADQASVAEGADHEDVKDSINKAIARFDDVEYETRARDIADEVLAAVPELGASIPELPAKLKKARNDLAHHLVRREKYDDLVEVLDHWLVASLVTPWLLRVLLLLRAGVAPETLRRSCMDHQRFEFVLANIAATASDLGWTTAQRPSRA